MKATLGKIILASSLAISLYADSAQKEIDKELQKLAKLKAIIEKKIAKNKEILASIQQEKANLEQLKRSIDKQIEEIQSQRYKKLAKDFESMDPEYAGEKLSKIDPKIAAYILYNMNSRKAGEALNFVAPETVSKITKILTQLRKNEQK